MDEHLGGGDSAARSRSELEKAIGHDLRLAAAQARHLTPEAQGAALPSVCLTVDLWPPHFRAGTRVYFERMAVETIPQGTYVLARHRGQTRICRFLEWAFDGRDLQVMTKVGGSAFAREGLPAKAILGVVVKVSRDGQEMDPNQQGMLDRLAGMVSDYGTLPVHRKAAMMAREMLSNLRRSKPKSARAAGFAQLLLDIRESEAIRKAEEERRAREAEKEKPLKSAAEPVMRLQGSQEDVLLQLGYRDPAY